VSFNNGLSERKVELIDLSTGEERSIKIWHLLQNRDSLR
jgi:hypothetical protein